MALGRQIINTGGAAVACTTDSVQAFGPDNAYSTNWALYQLDGNANDTTGNYNGTASNVTYSTGEFGQAAVFNGSSSYITLGSTTPLSNFDWFYGGGQTISAWIYPTAAVQQGIIGFGNDSTLKFNYLRMNSDRTLSFLLRDGSIATTSTTVGLVNLNAWNYVCVTADFNNITFYINGGAGEAFYSGFDWLISSESVDIGRRGGSADEYFNGSIDQIRLFDEAISEEEVATLYAETTSTASNTNPFGEGSGVALYTLDYDASDAGGLYNGTPTNVEFGVGGQINYAAEFDGSSEIDTGIDLDDYDEIWSISLWVKFTFNSSYRYIVGDLSAPSALNGFTIDLSPTGQIRFRFRNSSTSVAGITSTDTYGDGNWHHLTAIKGSSNNYLYIDGGQVGTVATVNGISHATNIILGRAGAYNGFYNGVIDQVRIFRSELNQSQVDILYAETACVYTPTTDIVNYPPGTTPIAYYKMDNSSEDYAGLNNGTDTNIEYTFGRFGQAAVFNGSSSYINLPDGISATGAYSISLWAYVPNISSSTPYNLFDFGAYPRECFTQNSTLYFRDYSDSGTQLFFINTSNVGNIATGLVHLAFIYSGTNAYIYVNGVQQATSSAISATRDITETFLGCRSGSGGLSNFLNGKLDQVRIYSTALSAGQVTELYNEKPETDTSNFKTVLYEGNGTTQYVSNVGYNLDVDNGGDGGMVWIKNRSAVQNHYLFDSVRGDFKAIYPDLTNAEFSSTNYISFDANGFTTGSTLNQNGNDYVGWVWKGGGDAVSNTDGSIASTVSANQAAGFSIVSYTGNGSSGATVGHGLNQEPELIIPKNRDAALSWVIGATPIGKSYILDLANGNPRLSRPNQYYYDWNSTTITMGSEAHVNGLNNKIIAYCFHSVAGYSKIGTYEGLGTSTVTVSDVGFKPSFIMIKNIDATANWGMYDLRRSTVPDRANGLLYPNLANAEVSNSSTYYFDMNDNGFVVSASNHEQQNKAGRTYLYMVFK